MNIRPLQDKILVKRLEADQKTASGIIIPDAAKEKPLEGVIVAVGKGKRADTGTLVQPDVAVGDHVLFEKYKGNDVKIDNTEHIILSEEDILGVIER